MKKSLLTLGVVAGMAAGASAQGLLTIGGSILFDTVTSSSATSTGFYTGNLTMEIFTIAAAGNANLATSINTDEQSLSTVAAGVNLITGGSWTQQQVGTFGGASGTEASSQIVNIGGGNLTSAGSVDVGTATSLPQTTSIYYALVFLNGTGGVEGGIVLNGLGGQDPATSPPNSTSNEYPSNAQNILLGTAGAPSPEPTSLALAGLGGLSMLFLRRRNKA